MKYSTVLSLTAIFTGYVLAVDPPSCSTTGDNTPITSSCCPRDSAKRLRRSAREIFARTDSPTCPTPKYYGDSCCTHEFEKPTLVTDPFNLQCGANGEADIVHNAVKVDIVGCDTADDLTKDTCYLMISSTPTGAITDTHLEISTTAWTSTKYPTKDPASWSYTSYCVKTTGVCKVPFNKIGDGASALCGKNLYIAYHTSTGDGTSSKTCTGDGTLIPGQPGNRWWEYLTLAFTCPRICDRWCCCEKPETPPPTPDCSVSGTAFAKPPSNADQQTLQGKGCGRWGWWNVFSPSSTYEARLLVGAGNNVGGTDVGKVVVSKCDSDPSKLTVTYTLDSPYKLTEVHVDLRCQPITEKSTGRTGTSGYPCAPGQYNVFKAGGQMCPASTGQSSYAISCIDPNVYDDGDNLGYTCTSTTDPMYAIFHASVYNGGAGCPLGSCDDTDAGE